MAENLLPFENIEYKVFIKRKAESSPEFGCAPENRSAEELIKYGVLNLNKPKGPTSHMVSDYVKKILNISKAGHSGTLDPGVTGVLPIALDRATRIVQVLLPAGKEYVGIMHLHKPVELEKLKSVLNNFIGVIEQMPPLKSAVVRKVRERSIYYLEILEIQGQEILFRVGCQAGTYIRKLCHDIGKRLGTGAHMAQLVRTKAGPFTDKDMTTLQDISDAYWYWKNEANEKYLRHLIKPVESAIPHLPKIWVVDQAVDTICHGANLNIPGISRLNDKIKPGSTVAIMTLKNELVSLGAAEASSQDIVLHDKGLAVTISKVFMDTGIYPKFKK